MATCTHASIEAAAGPLINSNLDRNQLLALRVYALAMAVKARGGTDYTSPAVLQPAVRGLFNAQRGHLAEMGAYLLLEQAAHYGATTVSAAAALKALNALFSSMGPIELQAAEVFLQCQLNAVLP